MQKLEKNQIKQAALMLSRAFKDGAKDLFPDPEERRVKEPLISEFHLRLEYSHGEAFITSPNLEGIAVWMRSDKIKNRSLWRIISSGSAWLAFRIGFKALRKMQKNYKYTIYKHNTLVPDRHWYIAALAVDPPHQGRGHASRLLKEGLRQVDKDNLPCYLETDGDKNVSIYRRFGFEVIDEFFAPGSDDKTIAMLRKPQKL